jgi:hypothetical protein
LIDSRNDDEVEEDDKKNNITTVPATTANELSSLWQRYALATLWFQTLDNFVDTFLNVQSTWGTNLDVCE